MEFDVHYIRVPLTWIITSQQIVNDLIEWFKALKARMLSIMFNWRPYCFIIDDTLQELQALS